MSDRFFRVDLLNQRTGYDPEVMREMFDVFKQAYSEYFELFDKYLNAEDWTRLSEIAHRAKSAVAIMGMEQIRTEFNLLEDLSSKAEKTDAYAKWIDDLRKRVETGASQIEEYLNSK